MGFPLLRVLHPHRRDLPHQRRRRCPPRRVPLRHGPPQTSEPSLAFPILSRVSLLFETRMHVDDTPRILPSSLSPKFGTLTVKLHVLRRVEHQASMPRPQRQRSWRLRQGSRQQQSSRSTRREFHHLVVDCAGFWLGAGALDPLLVTFSGFNTAQDLSNRIRKVYQVLDADDSGDGLRPEGLRPYLRFRGLRVLLVGVFLGGGWGAVGCRLD
eukprot:3383624-Rhodomonas_salina.1